LGDHRILGRGRIRRLANALKLRLGKGARDERGAVAIIFAFAVVVLVPLVLGLIDVYTATEQRARLQDALDAAALYAARSNLQTDAEIDALGDKALTSNLKLLRGATLLSSDFHLTSDKTQVIGSATIQPASIAPAFWGHPAVTVGTNVVRNSKNLEVSLVLDVTGSMDNSDKIGDLRTAAQDLVDLVVQDSQTPYYSKVAVVPWSMGVNVGAYADSVRGAPTPPKAITAASWASGSPKTITGATKADPVVITANGHGFSNGDKVFISGVSGMWQINNRVFTVANKTTNTFQLSGVDGRHYSTFKGSSGTPRVTKCQNSTCSLVVTSSGHGFTNGSYVVVTGLGGLTTAAEDGSSGSTHDVNNYTYTVASATTNTFVLSEAVGAQGSYTSGGNAYCTTYGCAYYRFLNPSGNARVYPSTTCVSERTGSYAYTDDAPGGNPVGFNYAADSDTTVAPTTSGDNPCLQDTIIPLSTDKTSLKAAIAGLQAAGSTGGQVGVAWGWYMVSPNFASLWPSDSRPAAYTAPDTLKVVVLMTDGALNTAYCNGVIAKDSLSGSGSSNDHINCNATNGSTFEQSKTLCDNMKAKGVIVYTVGFQITGDTTAEDLMSHCATDAQHQYLPTSGTALDDAFKAIGADINNLRLSH
jgi:Flp pilus assembly protein TadG